MEEILLLYMNCCEALNMGYSQYQVVQDFFHQEYGQPQSGSIGNDKHIGMGELSPRDRPQMTTKIIWIFRTPEILQ